MAVIQNRKCWLFDASWLGIYQAEVRHLIQQIHLQIMIELDMLMANPLLVAGANELKTYGKIIAMFPTPLSHDTRGGHDGKHLFRQGWWNRKEPKEEFNVIYIRGHS